MFGRRQFSIGVGALLAAPVVLRYSLRAQQARVRRDVMDIPDDDPFFSKYAEAVKAMHAETMHPGRSWIRQAQIHADYCRHGSLEFLHWHRHYLSLFERICGELIGDNQFALPYWNWTKRSGQLPNPFYDIDALNVTFWNDAGQYDGQMWGLVDTIGRRGLTRGKGLQSDPVRGGNFTTRAIDRIRTASTIELFRGLLEGGPHNSGHVIVGATASGKTGHIGSGLSPLDPIFWLHHCMVDRLWAEWQRNGVMTPDPQQDYVGFYDEFGNPVTLSTSGAMDVVSLGYTYDILESQPTVASPPNPDLFELVPQDQLLKQFRDGKSESLGRSESEGVTIPEVVTPISVKVPGIAERLQATRVFRDWRSNTGFGIEGQRLLASFRNVMPPEGPRDILVNVFVNCPYLDPMTSYNDPHYAGSFSFFGRMANMDHGQSFVVDITDPVRRLQQEGRIREDELTVQLMTVGASAEVTSKTEFRAGGVEIISE